MVKKFYLDGEWDFIVDLDPKYHGDVNIYPDPPYSRSDADHRHWHKVPVPGVWQKYGPRYEIYEGVCWFSREFVTKDYRKDMHARIRFGAVNYFCRVFLNGFEIGQHETGYTEFTVDASMALQNGYNHLAVMVDNRATTTKWPPCLGYFNYGGIHRSVFLEVIDDKCLDDIRLNGFFDRDQWVLHISGQVLENTTEQNKRTDDMRGNNTDRRSPLFIDISCCGIKSNIDLKEDGSFTGACVLHDVECWSPDTPNLYDITIRLMQNDQVHDIFSSRYGFRQIQAEAGKIYLNGDPITLKGICYVFDSYTTGLMMQPEQVNIDIDLMKEMGCNAVRCHYPMDELFYQACDQKGLFVWVEPNVYCYHPSDHETDTCFINPEWTGLAQQMACEMITVARNHPSVILYGIGNECNTKHPEAKRFFGDLASYIQLLDPSRLIAYAALYGTVGPIAEMVDVLGINSYWGWYDKIFGGKGLRPEDECWQVASEAVKEKINLDAMRLMLDKIINESSKKQVLLLTEFGADSVPGYLSKSLDLWSENYHAELLMKIFKLCDDYPQIAGTFPFCFSDYRDPSKVCNGYWSEQNLKGVVNYERRKKAAFFALKSQYSGSS